MHKAHHTIQTSKNNNSENLSKEISVINNNNYENKKKSSKDIFIALLLNFFFVIIELLGGILTNSIAILSDAIHDFGDCIAIGFAFALEKKSNKKPNKKYTYGYRRYSVISALITSTILLAGGVIVIYSSIIRIINPKPINGLWMLIIAGFGVTINGFAAIKTAKSNNINEKAINLHLLEDVLGWIVVLIGSIFVYAFNWTIIDPILSIFVSLFIIYNVIKHFISIFSILTEKSPKQFDQEKYIDHILAIENIINVHHLHAWSLDGEETIITMHVIVKNNCAISETIEIKNKIVHIGKKFGVVHSTIQFDLEEEFCNNKSCELEYIQYESHNHHHYHHH